MNLLKRVTLSIKRRLGKSIILFACVFLLATLMSGTISINQAIINTDQSLRRRLPAVATLVICDEVWQAHFELTGTFLEASVTPSMIREIGALPYVDAFDYTAWGFNFFSSELTRAFDESLFSRFDLPTSDIRDIGSLSYWNETPLEHFTLKGGQHTAILDIEAGLIELTAGRTFTEEEIETLAHVAVVSQDFLEANDLALGSFLTFEYLIFDELASYGEEYLASQRFELEIVGVFEKELAFEEKIDEVQNYFAFVNRIYVPNAVVESIVDLYMEVLPEIDPDYYAEILAIDEIENIINYDDFLFLLHDPSDLVAFANAAAHILPPSWRVEDLSNSYADISNSMAMMNDIANSMRIGTIIATLFILGLLILLFLMDRKSEVGIYLALGEKKYKILLQLLLEIISVAIIGMTLSLFLGNLIGDQVSQKMIEQDMMRQLENPDRVERFGLLHGMGFRVALTHEDMLELYEVTINTRTVVLFYSVTLSTILVATTIPMLIIVNMKPKEVLL